MQIECGKCGKESEMMLRIPAGVMGSRVDNLGWWVGQEMLISLYRRRTKPQRIRLHPNQAVCQCVSALRDII